ncbi:hypothetical protein ACJ72_01504 [Emergomyces africanus]|uniref:Uncharacterized protein n=1 Tax=Emergomyces africanus TaxID=1955775 RepID=A0A1B7P576_9EURO|nr:hypothetical protein ACJ72_01504 [Emergomyces africanus]
MGCSSSKVQGDNDRPNTGYSKPRPATRPPIRPQSHRERPQGEIAPGTGAGKRTRPPSAVPKPHSSVQPRNRTPATRSRAQVQTGTRTRQSRAGAHRRHSTALGTIPDGQPPEDSAIRDEIKSFRLYIDQHSINFYRTECDDSGASISRYIARTIITNVIEKRLSEPHSHHFRNIWLIHDEENSVALNLANALEKYARDPSNEKRSEHLLILCRTASMIGRMMDRHPESWEFSWRGGVDIQFPSVMRGQTEFMPATVDI